MARSKSNKYAKREEALRNVTNAYNAAADIFGKDKVKLAVDERNKRYTLTRPDTMDGVVVLHFTWG